MTKRWNKFLTLLNIEKVFVSPFLGGGIGSSFLPPLLPALVEGERLFLLSSLLL